MRTFRRAGGEAWLLEQAKAAPLEFLKALIAVTKPQPQAKATEPEPPPAGGVLSDFEAARRVAFCLASAMHADGQPLTVEGEIVVEPAPSWTPPADQEQPVVEQPQQGADELNPPVEQPRLPEPEPVQPERRSLADLLGFEPPPAVEPSLYGGGVSQYRSGDSSEMGTQRRDLIGDVRVVQGRETVAQKYRRMKGEG